MASPPTNDHHYNHHYHPPPPVAAAEPQTSKHSIPMLLPVFILFFILMCFLSIFLFRDLLHYFSTTWLRSSTARRGRPSSNGGTHHHGDPGLDPAIISSFPTLPYSAVRGLQEGQCGAECAVCLSEFNGRDVIRLLTVCCHAFHPACIDSWLASHTTCPMCRSDLEAPPDEAAVLAVQEAVGGGGGGGESHVISVEEGEGELKSNSMEHSIEIGRRKDGDEGEESGYTIRTMGITEDRTAAYHTGSGRAEA